LKVEKEIGGRSEGGVRLQLLGVGCYPFMGELNPETAQGVVIAE
jgi:phosphoenolpyruvate carboxylase